MRARPTAPDAAAVMEPRPLQQALRRSLPAASRTECPTEQDLGMEGLTPLDTPLEFPDSWKRQPHHRALESGPIHA